MSVYDAYLTQGRACLYSRENVGKPQTKLQPCQNRAVRATPTAFPIISSSRSAKDDYAPQNT